MDDLSSEFLDAFSSIEKHLRRLLDANRHMTFGELVEKAARIDRAVGRLRGPLKEFGDLRNFVVHEYRRDRPVAVPSEHSVGRLKAIRDELLSPPTLISLFRRDVQTCAPDDPIGKAVGKMHVNSYSQLPVYEGRSLVGLLTSGTVARWLASHLGDGQGILEEEPVGAVLRHAENEDNYLLMSRGDTVFDALAAFDESLGEGRTLDAIILTPGARGAELPVGIVTVADIPAMHRRVVT